MRRIKVYITLVNEFIQSIREKKINNLDKADKKDIEDFIINTKKSSYSSPLSYATALQYYFEFKNKKVLTNYTKQLRGLLFNSKKKPAEQKNIRIIKSPFPQILYITNVTHNNSISINKLISSYLDIHTSEAMDIMCNNEIICVKNGSHIPESAKKNIISLQIQNKKTILPPQVVSKLDLHAKDHVAFIERENTCVLKKAEINKKTSIDFYSRVVDKETPLKLVREIHILPDIKESIKILQKKYKNKAFTYSFYDFIRGKKTYACWLSRKLLNRHEYNDEKQKEQLIQERFNTQHKNGSWGDLPMTTRMLRECAELGAGQKSPHIEKGIKWLLYRPESEFNPRMFFLEDNMVNEQQKIIQKRLTQGNRDRFRKRNKRYELLIAEGDGVSLGGCGPQIMWPSALALEALLKWKFEHHERVGRLYNTLSTMPTWCECAYQHGTSDGNFTGRHFSIKELEDMEGKARTRAYNAGLSDVKNALKWHQSQTKYIYQKRVEQLDKQVYLVEPERSTNGCGVLISRALRHSSNKKMKILAGMYLWQCVNLQNINGGFSELDSGRLGQFIILSCVSEWDHPAARFIILRAVPWLMQCQNTDGSWGTESKKEYTTLIVIKALKNAGIL